MKTAIIILCIAFSGCATVKPRDQSNKLLESATQFLDSLLIYTINR